MIVIKVPEFSKNLDVSINNPNGSLRLVNYLLARFLLSGDNTCDTI